ncbi:MAG: tetratricopeptide repeat protein [Deltaproteobacteria bacterium]|nr:tetratricopeptide repeat protein [Deltaproteobacteria bacterium]
MTTARRRAILATALVAAAAVLVYANAIGNSFVYDDLELLAHNRLIQAGASHVADIGGASYWGGARADQLYRPLTIWSLALDWSLNAALGREGRDPVVFLLSNVLLHAVVACIILRLLVLLGGGATVSLIAALLFAVHPIHTEAVVQAVGRAELLALLFGLLFLRAHLRRSALLGGSAFALALLSKESAVAFLGLAVVMDIFFQRRPRRRSVVVYALYAVVLAAWLGLRANAVGVLPAPHPFIDNPLFDASPSARIATAALVQMKYLALELIPVGLSSDYSYNQIPLAAWNQPAVAGFFALAPAAAAAALAWRKSHPLPGFALVGYAVLFAPTSNFLFPIGTIMGERLAYAPSFLFLTVAACGVDRLARRMYRIPLAAAAACLLGLVVALGCATAARNRTWADEETFFRTQLASAPQSAKAHYNFGCLRAKKGDDHAAIESYRRAIALLPSYPEPFFNLGNALRRVGAEPQAVVDAYRSAIRLDPGQAKARANLALFLTHTGDFGEARTLTAELEAIQPDHPALETLHTALGAARSLPDQATGTATAR